MERSPESEPESLPSVGRTAVGVAALRALESNRPDRLFDDPYAGAFFAAGRSLFPEAPPELDAAGPAPDSFGALFALPIAVRTRRYDDQLPAAGCPQVVLLAAGLDTRAFRLAWPDGVRVFELDLPEVLRFKGSVLNQLNSTPRCARAEVPADLREDWSSALRAAGFQPEVPTAWLAEGLLVYLTREQATDLLATVTALSPPGSRLFFEDRPAEVSAELTSRFRTAPGGEQILKLWLGGLAGTGAGWLAEHGWSTEQTSMADVAESYGRSSDLGRLFDFVAGRR